MSKKLLNTVNELISQMSTLYDEYGNLLEDERSKSKIRIIKNLSDDLQFMDLVNQGQYDKYWFVDVIKKDTDFTFTFGTSNTFDYQFYHNVHNNNINKYYYYSNYKNFNEDEYKQLIINIQHEFFKSLHESAFNTSLTKRKFIPSDYKLNNESFKQSKIFNIMIDLSTSITIIEIKVNFSLDMIKIEFEILDETSSPKRNSLQSLTKNNRNQKRRLSAEDITTLDHVVEFYIKLLNLIIKEEVEKL